MAFALSTEDHIVVAGVVVSIIRMELQTLLEIERELPLVFTERISYLLCTSWVTSCLPWISLILLKIEHALSDSRDSGSSI